jgi:hypothetical protein
MIGTAIGEEQERNLEVLIFDNEVEKITQTIPGSDTAVMGVKPMQLGAR